MLLALAGTVLDVAVALLAAGSSLARRWGYPAALGLPWIVAPGYPDRRRLEVAMALSVGFLAVAGWSSWRRWQECRRHRQGRGQERPRRRGTGHLAAGTAGTGSAAAAGDALVRLAAAALPVALPVLVAVWLAAVAPVYPLLAFSRWSARYEHSAVLAPGVGAARRVLFATLAPLLAATLTATAARLGRLRETGDTHGSSHWASAREVAATGLLPARRAAAPAGLHPVQPATAEPPPPGPPQPPEVVVGAWHGRAPGELRPRLHRLTDRRDRHVLAFAPSGSGKSTCLVIPTLLTWTSSVVVLDIKGELWHLTSDHRRRVLGQRCLRLDLAAIGGGSGVGGAAAYNPLLLIPRGPGDVKHAQSVADVLVDPEGRDQPRTFWEQSAHALLTAVILHVVYTAEAAAPAPPPPEEASGTSAGDEPEPAPAAAASPASGSEATLAACARLLSDPRRLLQDTLEALLVTHHDPGLDQGWRDAHTGGRTYTHPVVAAAAQSLLDMDPRTSSGIVATAQVHLALFRDPILAANTARSDFAPLDLVNGERPLSLYLTLAPADLDRLRGPIRLVLNQLCRALTERLDFETGSGRPAHRRPLLLLLDEFPVLGKLDFFGRAMAYLRGYGIRVYLSIQSLAQLHEIYGRHQSITANCPVQIAFAPADLETAEQLSRMLGQTTVHLAKRSLNGAPLVLGPRRHTLSVQEVGRPLLTPEEVRRLPDGEAVVFVAGHAPIRGRRVAYFAEWGR